MASFRLGILQSIMSPMRFHSQNTLPIIDLKISAKRGQIFLKLIYFGTRLKEGGVHSSISALLSPLKNQVGSPTIEIKVGASC